MATLGKLLLVNRLRPHIAAHIRHRYLCLTATRLDAGGPPPWNKEWKPLPYPKTEEEWVAAAKKYGMRREDYEPHADDGMGFGDYPKFEPATGTMRDPYYDWDCPVLLRNYGEPLHVHADIYNEERLDVSVKPPYSYPVLFAAFFGVMGLWIAAFVIMEPYPQTHPYMDSQMPYTPDGKRVIHYTFEPADS